MSEARHFPGTVVSVVADDNGQVICSLCDDSVDPDAVYLLLRIPGTTVWHGWCHACTRQFAMHYVKWADAVDHDWNDGVFFAL